MKKLFATILMLGIMPLAFAQTNYGEKIDESKAVSMEQFLKSMEGKTEMEATISAPVSSVCQAEGCWMKVDKGNKVDMLVRMKDHKFLLPKDIAGKNSVFTGTAKVKTTTVEMLKHYAEDENKSAEYIAAIKEPKTEIIFEATGVLIK